MAEELPMFPLGSVLFPTMLLPLQLFEPRYLELARVCTTGRPEFGVVLIERGSEVGGGDTRLDVGCLARIVEATELPGRWLLATVGTERIRVERWLSDSPYPKAEVAAWPDPPASAAAGEQVERAHVLLRRALAMSAELAEPVPPATVEIDADPATASHQLAALAPFGPADRYRLLVAPSVEARLELLATLLDEEVAVLARRLAGG